MGWFRSSNRSISSSGTYGCSQSSAEERCFVRQSLIASLDNLQYYEGGDEILEVAMALSASLEPANNFEVQDQDLELKVPAEEEEVEQREKDLKSSENESGAATDSKEKVAKPKKTKKKVDIKEDGEQGEGMESSQNDQVETAKHKNPEKKSKKSKKKKKKKKEDSDGTSTKKTKNKNKKSKKKKSETVSAKVAETSADNDVPPRVQGLPLMKRETVVLDAIPEKRKKVYSPIFDSPGGGSSSPAKRESFPDAESILSKLSEFEQAWREASNSRHGEEEKQDEPVPQEEEALSMAETILDSTASVGTSTFDAHHGQYSVVSRVSQEKARDFRRQAISLAAAETMRRAEAEKSSNLESKNNSSTAYHVNWRLPDDADGADQPISAASSSWRIIPPAQEGKQAYMEGVKAASILDIKRQQPGAFHVTGPQVDNPAEDGQSDEVLVAALTHEDEAQIEERVMKRLLKETAQASVILVEHGGNSKKYEDPIGEAERQAELMEIYKPQGLVEKILGDGQVPVDVNSAPDDFIKRRNHIPFTIKLHGTTNLWVTSVQTSQKASDSSQYMYERTSLELKRTVKTYIAMTEQEAYEIGLAMAPPIMNSFDENPICQLCSGKFALLKRPCNCRNCGVVICSGCSCSWSSKQIPSTYITENRSNHVNVCVACDWLATSFREALLEGNLRRAQSLYQTGNVNLRKVYGGGGGSRSRSMMLGDEAMYPIQLAVRGGNLSVVKWLMFEHYCPLYESNKGKVRTLLKTSKGRTVIDLALEQPKPEILKFLVTNQGVSLMDGAKKENRDSLKHLMRLVQLIPETMLANVSVDDPFPRIERDAEVPDASTITNSLGNDDDQCAF